MYGKQQIGCCIPLLVGIIHLAYAYSITNTKSYHTVTLFIV